jgi:hypothetical protein
VRLSCTPSLTARAVSGPEERLSPSWRRCSPRCS